MPFSQFQKKNLWAGSIINSGNDYIAALKGNQPSSTKDVKKQISSTGIHSEQINKGHGRIEKVMSVFVKTLDCVSVPGPTYHDQA